MDVKIKEIHERRKFQNFWECVDYLILASYSELDSIMSALELFEGKIWDSVITVAKFVPSKTPSTMAFASGATYTFSGGTTLIAGMGLTTTAGSTFSTAYGSEFSIDEDDLFAHIYVITDKGNKHFKELYKAYIETKEYEEQKELENHYKRISINLKSELAIRLFNGGYSQFK